MAKQLRFVDAFIDHTDDFVYAQVIHDPELAAAGPDEDVALARLGLAVEKVLKLDPTRKVGLEGDVVSRHLRIRVPGSAGSRLLQLDLQLFAVCEARPIGYLVWLPQLRIQFEIDSLENLETIASEWVRDEIPMRYRVEQLQRFTAPLTRTSHGERLARMRTERIEVRFRPERVTTTDTSLTPTLSAVGEHLNPRMLKRDAPRAFERRAEVETILDYLSESNERSILLTGPQGVGKTAILYEAAYRIAKGEAPEQLRNIPIWQISGGRLLAGMRFLGQWQERVLTLIEEVKEVGAILFAENLIELLETAGSEKHTQGIPGMLLPHMLSGDLVIITEARPEQLARAEQSHPSFLRALRKLPVEPMTAGRADKVLDRVSFRIGRQFGVRLAPETRERILELVGRFRGAAALPGPAVELAERMARTHQNKAVEKEGSDRPVLTPEHAVEAYASITGLPRPLLDPSAEFSLKKVQDHFNHAIFDQPEGVQAIIELVTTMRAGLNNPQRPLGSFLFLGPTGVGKTQTALTLAEYLFGNRDRMARFDMSEYQDAWAAGRLVGRYQGEQGDLVRRVREQPFTVLLLDEIEKAHASVFDFLLQVLGEGRLTDGLGQTVSLTSCVIIMTSNLGAGGPSSLGFGMRTDDSARNAEVAHYTGAVEKFFRPEFVGRIDKIIPFRSLSQRTARQLVERALEQAFAREGLSRRRIRVKATEEVIEFLIKFGFDEKYGARPLRQAVEHHITAPLAKFLAAEGGIEDFDLLFTLAHNVPTVELV